MNTLKFQITEKCDTSCKFCSNTRAYLKESSVDDVKEMIEYLPKGIEKIIITGGEPLLSCSLEETLCLLKQKGYQLALETNGITLEQQKKVLQYVDKVILPLDSLEEETLETMGRNPHQSFTTIRNIYLIKLENPNIDIEISTTLTAKNIEQLEDLLEIIQLFPFINWNIYQFIPYDVELENVRDFLVDDDTFEQVKIRLEACKIASRIKMFSIQEQQNQWFITPSLQLMNMQHGIIQKYVKVTDIEKKTLTELFTAGKIYKK